MRIEAKKTLLAGAVATAMGVAATVSVADEIMFPYVVGSHTVTTLVSVVNVAGGPWKDGDQLHYTYLYKAGVGDGGANDNMAPCNHTNFYMPTSKNDIVTFDMIEQFGEAEGGVLFNDDSNYGADSFAAGFPGFEPIRSFLIVDNNEIEGAGENTMYGEAMVFEFGSGAAFGYRAYNAQEGAPEYVFSDMYERNGEVLKNAGTPVTILPFNEKAEFTQKFLVTPIWEDGFTDADTDYGSQNAKNLGVKVALCANNTCSDLSSPVMYDRDEGPESGIVPVPKVCVGAIDTDELVDKVTANRLPDGGWSNLVIQPYPVSAAIKDGVWPTDAAVVLKLDYNKVIGSFNGQSSTRNGSPVGGVFNNAVWLRHGMYGQDALSQ
jgi:hypothetical protein